MHQELVAKAQLQKEIYARLVTALTTFEETAVDATEAVEELYKTLVLVQNSWEEMGLQS
jgi:hypothetical protein